MMELLHRLKSALDDRYHIERELGGGGMSRVFMAREHGLNREVVVKVLSEDVAAGVSLERFEREIRVAASLQQANIVPLLAAGNAGGVPFYTMPFVQGESLRRRLRESPALSLSETVGILKDVARALSYAHARGVVHRDIKPDNVLLSHGAAVVTDFGIAKAVSASRTSAGGDTLTQAGSSLGTPAYMAPEQVAGDPNVDHRADIYAWGCLAYELLTGAPPFVSETPHRVLAMHLRDAPVPVGERRPDAPPVLAALVMQCLAKDASDRPADADELLRELEAVATPSRVTTPGIAAPGRRETNVRWIAIGAGAIAVLAILTLIVVTNKDSAAGAPEAATDKSVAVLPLANLSGDKADDYFGIGLAEEMTRALAKAGARVIGRSSAGALQARGLDDRAIARELGVGSLLTGSVQRAGDQLRISVTLAAADGAVRWTQAYDRPVTNVFAVQDEIAREVARELLGSLNLAAPGTLVRNETSDPEAHSLLLQGIVLWNRRSEQSLRRSIGLFEQALLRDPKYARAEAWLALATNTLAFYTDDSTDPLLNRALEAAAKALELDSTVSEAHTAAGSSLMMLGRNAESAERFRQALALDSTMATNWGWSGLLAYRRGDLTEALRRVRRAVDMEPASLVSRTQIAQVLIASRRFPEADSVARSVISLDSSFGLAWVQRAEALAGLGRFAEAIEIMEKRAKTVPGVRRSELDGVHAWLLAVAERRTESRALLEQLRVRSGGRLPPVASVASALDALGDSEAAVALLSEAAASHDPWLWLARTIRFDRLRKDPRVVALLAPFETE